MKIILLKDVKNIGKTNDVVIVSDGYAKNYLIKNKLAVLYTQNADKKLAIDLKKLDEKEQANISNANQLKDKIEQVSLKFKLKTTNGNAFGSISYKKIIDELINKQIKIDKYMFDSSNEKMLGLGIHHLKINLYKNVFADLKVIVEEE
ncbi:MAG: 50S ribosomal protein L9 [Mycoplasmataceae bacterium]|jgi:large subunit ribosomal protein L9|nr:50S ribosomal protein L9 [Mycoplasmataceae bacterium]